MLRWQLTIFYLFIYLKVRCFFLYFRPRRLHSSFISSSWPTGASAAWAQPQLWTLGCLSGTGSAPAPPYPGRIISRTDFFKFSRKARFGKLSWRFTKFIFLEILIFVKHFLIAGKFLWNFCLQENFIKNAYKIQANNNFQFKLHIPKQQMSFKKLYSKKQWQNLSKIYVSSKNCDYFHVCQNFH